MPKNSPDEKKQRRSKKNKDPNAPKRAMSAFMFFSNDVRDSVRKERPDLQFLEIASEIGRRWQSLPDSKRKKYQAMADKDKQRYLEEKEDYVPDPSYAQKVQRKKKDPNAPKRGLSAYMFYCNEFRPAMMKKHPGRKITEIASMLAAEWKNLDDEERKEYQAMADKDKERYQLEMEEFNSK